MRTFQIVRILRLSRLWRIEARAPLAKSDILAGHWAMQCLHFLHQKLFAATRPLSSSSPTTSAARQGLAAACGSQPRTGMEGAGRGNGRKAEMQAEPARLAAELTDLKLSEAQSVQFSALAYQARQSESPHRDDCRGGQNERCYAVALA